MSTQLLLYFFFSQISTVDKCMYHYYLTKNNELFTEMFLKPIGKSSHSCLISDGNCYCHGRCGKPEIGYTTEFLISLPVTN